MTELDLSQQRTLINHLHSQLASGEEAELIETHISWVILAGDYAYKLKKSIDFGFLDYSTLEKRRRQCEAELRLNNRTAANIYLDVVAIGGQTDAPLIDQQPAIEYMVKMHRFPQHALFSQQLKQKRLKPIHIDLLAEQVAEFHRTTERAAEDSEFGTPATLFQPISENFEQIRERIDNLELLQRLEGVEQQSREFFETHQPLFTQRKADSFIRDCHGDLHLNNIILLDEKPQLFDCIEFNARLRIIDVISEIAFLVMDLQEHGADHLANQFLNRYLELSGDYEGVRLLPFYLSYRAMVRAKVATLRLDQTNLKHAQRQKVLNDFSAYLSLAERYSQGTRPHLIITHGLSGSGKSTITEPLLEKLNAIRIRSDVERKRLFGLDALAHSGSDIGTAIYSRDATEQTYTQLASLTTAILAGGYTVVVDATFLKHEQRERFRSLATQLKLPFHIISFQAPSELLRKWITERSALGDDPSEAGIEVLDAQLHSYQPLEDDELDATIVIDDR